MPPIFLSYVCLSQIYHLPLLIIIPTKLSQSLYNQSSVLSLYQPLTKEKQMHCSSILQVLQSARPKFIAILDKLLDYTLLTAIVIVLLAVPSYLNTLWGRSLSASLTVLASVTVELWILTAIAALRVTAFGSDQALMASGRWCWWSLRDNSIKTIWLT